MAARRSRPFMIAPLIPFWGVIGIFGIEQLHGTRYLTAFVVVMILLLCTLFTYVLQRTIEAKRTRPGRLKFEERR